MQKLNLWVTHNYIFHASYSADIGSGMAVLQLGIVIYLETLSAYIGVLHNVDEKWIWIWSIGWKIIERGKREVLGVGWVGVGVGVGGTAVNFSKPAQLFF